MATSISKRGAVLKRWSCFDYYCERPLSLLWLIIQRKLSTKKWHYFLLLCTDILAQYEKMFKGTFLRKSAAFWPTFCGPCVPKLDNFLIELSQELSIRKWLSKDIGCFEGQESLNFFVKFSGNLVYRNLTTFCSNYHRPHLFWFSNNLQKSSNCDKIFYESFWGGRNMIYFDRISNGTFCSKTLPYLDQTFMRISFPKRPIFTKIQMKLSTSTSNHFKIFKKNCPSKPDLFRTIFRGTWHYFD